MRTYHRDTAANGHGVPEVVFRGSLIRDELVGLFSRGNAGEHEPRLLVTGLPARLKRCRQYRTRMCRQESFRDEKSHGYHWHHSRVSHPERPDRLPLAMRSAMWMTMILGEKVERLGNRAEVKATPRSTRSVFSPGYRAWRKPHVLTAIRSPITLRFDPYNQRRESVGYSACRERRVSVGCYSCGAPARRSISLISSRANASSHDSMK